MVAMFEPARVMVNINLMGLLVLPVTILRMIVLSYTIKFW